MIPPTDNDARKGWMATLAKAPAARLAALMPDLPAHALLRPPETGTVMVRGRVGGTGAPFNLGEMTVTRASVRLADGGTVVTTPKDFVRVPAVLRPFIVPVGVRLDWLDSPEPLLERLA